MDIKGAQIIRPEQSVFKHSVYRKVKVQDINQVLAAITEIPHSDIIKRGFEMHAMVYL